MFWTRHARHAMAWVALVATLCGVALPVLETHPVGVADDAACAVVLDAHGAAAPVVSAPHVRDHRSDHCVVCHLQRALGGAFASDVAVLASPLVATAALPSGSTTPIFSAISASTSRGPPARSAV